MPISGDYLNISSRVPSEGAPPRPPPQSLIRERSPIPWALLQVPQMGPLWKEMPVSRAISTYPSGSQARKPSLQVPFTELPQRGTPHLQRSFQPYLEVPGRWAYSRLLIWAPIKRDAYPQSLPFITFRACSKGALPPGPPNRAPTERDAPSPETPYNNLSELPVNGPP